MIFGGGLQVLRDLLSIDVDSNADTVTAGRPESTTSQSNLSGRNKSGFYGALLHVVSAINNENHQQGFVSGYDKPFNYYFLFF